MDAVRKQLLGVMITAVTLVTMSSCSPDVAVPTTAPAPSTKVQTTTAPSTTPAPTIAPPTTPAPTTQPPTTAPPTSTTATPEELLGQRALQLERDLAECYAMPSECDIEDIIAAYYIRDSASLGSIRQRFQLLLDNHTRWTQIDNIDDQLMVTSISPDGRRASTTVCSINRAVEVDADSGEIVDDGVGYFRVDTDWQLDAGGQWMAISDQVIDASAGSDPVCDF